MGPSQHTGSSAGHYYILTIVQVYSEGGVLNSNISNGASMQLDLWHSEFMY